MLLTSLLMLTACDDGGLNFVPDPDPNNPGIVHLGEMTPSPVADARANAYFGTLGSVEPGKTGGATATFLGTGDEVCVWVDPESVFWNQSVAIQNRAGKYAYPDHFDDDGDLDIEVGLSAFYTGSPGIEMGDFQAVYEDSLGNESYIEFNECTITDIYGQSGAHAGRGTIEFCTIDTSAHPGKEYTIVLNTWSLPSDDYSLAYGFALFEGSCSDLQDGNYSATSIYGTTVNVIAASPTGECFLMNEVGLADGSDDEDFGWLEGSFCAEEQVHHCCVQYPENKHCSDEPTTEDVCPESYLGDF